MTMLVEKIRKGLKSTDIRGMSDWKGQLVTTLPGKPLGFYAKNTTGKEELHMTCKKLNPTETYIEGSGCTIMSCTPDMDDDGARCAQETSEYIKFNMEIGGARKITDFTPEDEPKARSFYLP